MTRKQIASILLIFLLVIIVFYESLPPYGVIYNVLHPKKQIREEPSRPRFPSIPPYIGLFPQQVVTVNAQNLSGLNPPLRDTYQRKVFFDGANFFLVYWDANNKEVKYVASSDGKVWSSPTTLWVFGVGPYYGGNVDVCYPNRGSKDYYGEEVDLAMHFAGSNGETIYWYPFVISQQTLIMKTGGSLGGKSKAQGGTIVSNLNGNHDYLIYHRDDTNNLVETFRSVANQDDADGTVPHGGTTSGGNQLLPYKTSSPYKMLALAKGGDNKLYYAIVNEPTATFANGFTELATLTEGFSDFCACSEAQNIGDPEIVHLVYIKSSGELCYRKFENDVWSDEFILVQQGVSYPVIAVGKKLYVFFVKENVIWIMIFDGAVWSAPMVLFPQHNYNNPTYLSCNQNVQNGKICLAWTEGTTPPYEIWFSYIEDI